MVYGILPHKLLDFFVVGDMEDGGDPRKIDSILRQSSAKPDGLTKLAGKSPFSAETHI